MIERIDDLPEGVLGFRAGGMLTRDEYREMLAPIYDTLERGEKLDIYFELVGHFHLDAGAAWEDLKAAGSVGLKHRSSWHRMALVTDRDWIRHAVAIVGPLVPGELRVFAPDENDQARAWISS